MGRCAIACFVIALRFSPCCFCVFSLYVGAGFFLCVTWTDTIAAIKVITKHTQSMTVVFSWDTRYIVLSSLCLLVGAGDAPFLGLWGAKYVPIARPYRAFLLACATGRLPHVSYVDPRFVEELTGTTSDDHPHADIRNGEAFLNEVYTAVTNGPAWPRTLLVINFDEWGGFFEHVPPETAAIPPASAAAGDTDGLRGFRVPCLLVSPLARRRFVAGTLFDHTSVLRFIEWRWDLEPLTIRDATANNLADALDFAAPRARAPQYAVSRTMTQ